MNKRHELSVEKSKKYEFELQTGTTAPHICFAGVYFLRYTPACHLTRNLNSSKSAANFQRPLNLNVTQF